MRSGDELGVESCGKESISRVGAVRKINYDTVDEFVAIKAHEFNRIQKPSTSSLQQFQYQ